MQLIYKPRNSGKTTELIAASYLNDCRIVCADEGRRQHIKNLAEKLTVPIAEPMLFQELINPISRYRGQVMIDDLDDCLAMFPFDVKLATITNNE